MAFTASALSFMLGKHLGKPVIVTGSQVYTCINICTDSKYLPPF
jgi:L-asparaginase/Glu-tRNA(Gln) amidotransferase subunit D